MTGHNIDGWVKHFTDGSVEVGSNQRVLGRLASWTLGRQDSIWGVCLTEGNLHVSIDGSLVAPFHQSDEMEIKLLGSQPITVSRRIQRQFVPGDEAYYVKEPRPNCLELTVICAKDFSRKINGKLVKIKPDMIGRWLTLDMNLLNYELTYKILSLKA